MVAEIKVNSVSINCTASILHNSFTYAVNNNFCAKRQNVCISCHCYALDRFYSACGYAVGFSTTFHARTISSYNIFFNDWLYRFNLCIFCPISDIFFQTTYNGRAIIKTSPPVELYPLKLSAYSKHHITANIDNVKLTPNQKIFNFFIMVHHRINRLRVPFLLH